MNYLPYGTEITCPRCGIVVAILKQDTYKDYPLSKHMLYFMHHDDYRMGTYAKCKDCNGYGNNWYEDGKLHTKEGWV